MAGKLCPKCRKRLRYKLKTPYKVWTHAAYCRQCNRERVLQTYYRRRKAARLKMQQWWKENRSRMCAVLQKRRIDARAHFRQKGEMTKRCGFCMKLLPWTSFTRVKKEGGVWLARDCGRCARKANRNDRLYSNRRYCQMAEEALKKMRRDFELEKEIVAPFVRATTLAEAG